MPPTRVSSSNTRKTGDDYRQYYPSIRLKIERVLLSAVTGKLQPALMAHIVGFGTITDTTRYDGTFLTFEADSMGTILSLPGKQRERVFGTARLMATCLRNEKIAAWVSPRMGSTAHELDDRTRELVGQLRRFHHGRPLLRQRPLPPRHIDGIHTG